MKIKNWSKFQHFKDRRPPWIKLYRDLLDDMQWHQLDPLASKVLVTLWLLASEDQEGCLPDTKTLAWRMRMTEKQILDCISKLSHWLEHDDSSVISERYQDDLPETETETETEIEIEKETKKKGASAEIVFPEGLDQQAWTRWVDYRKAAGKTLKPVSWPSAMDALVKHGSNQMAVVEQSIANGWQGLFALKPGAITAVHADGKPLNKQEALEASNRAVVARLLAKEAQRASQ